MLLRKVLQRARRVVDCSRMGITSCVRLWASLQTLAGNDGPISELGLQMQRELLAHSVVLAEAAAGSSFAQCSSSLVVLVRRMLNEALSQCRTEEDLSTFLPQLVQFASTETARSQASFSNSGSHVGAALELLLALVEFQEYELWYELTTPIPVKPHWIHVFRHEEVSLFNIVHDGIVNGCERGHSSLSSAHIVEFLHIIPILRQQRILSQHHIVGLRCFAETHFVGKVASLALQVRSLPSTEAAHFVSSLLSLGSLFAQTPQFLFPFEAAASIIAHDVESTMQHIFSSAENSFCCLGALLRALAWDRYADFHKKDAAAAMRELRAKTLRFLSDMFRPKLGAASSSPEDLARCLFALQALNRRSPGLTSALLSVSETVIGDSELGLPFGRLAPLLDACSKMMPPAESSDSMAFWEQCKSAVAARYLDRNAVRMRFEGDVWRAAKCAVPVLRILLSQGITVDDIIVQLFKDHWSEIIESSEVLLFSEICALVSPESPPKELVEAAEILCIRRVASGPDNSPHLIAVGPLLAISGVVIAGTHSSKAFEAISELLIAVIRVSSSSQCVKILRCIATRSSFLRVDGLVASLLCAARSRMRREPSAFSEEEMTELLMLWERHAERRLPPNLKAVVMAAAHHPPQASQSEGAPMPRALSRPRKSRSQS